MLLRTLPTVHAYESLYDPEVGGHMNAEEIHDLALRAGFGKEAADKMAKERALARLRKDLPA